MFIRSFVLMLCVISHCVWAFDAYEMLCLVNTRRAAANKAPLGYNAALINAAQAHSDEQARRGAMSHQFSGQPSPSARVKAAGYNARGMAENVAYGCRSEADCMERWMNSAGHKANILGDYQHFGSAVAYNGGTPYYTQVFARNGEQGNYPVCPGRGDTGATPAPVSTPAPSVDTIKESPALPVRVDPVQPSTSVSNGGRKKVTITRGTRWGTNRVYSIVRQPTRNRYQ